MTDKNIELNVEELDTVTGGATLGITGVTITDIVNLLKVNPGIDALRKMAKQDLQGAVDWVIENIPGQLSEKYSDYSLIELKDFVAKYAAKAIQLLVKF